MKNLDEKLLARYFDGELTDSQSKQVESLLKSDEASQESLKSMSMVSDLFSITEEEALKDVSFDGLDKRILNSIEADSKPSLADNLSTWFSEFFTYKKSVWIPAASFAGAAAALMFIVGTSNGIPQMPDTQGGQTWEASAASTTLSSQVKTDDDSVEANEYSIKNSDGSSIGVVWIND